MPNVAPPVALECWYTSLNLYYTTYSARLLLGPSVIKIILVRWDRVQVWFDLATTSRLSPMLVIRLLVKLIRRVKYCLLVLSYSLSYMIICYPLDILPSYHYTGR